MIKKIELENFKMFKDKTVFDNIRRMTILTGCNGKGKSSLIQSLAIVAQSVGQNEAFSSLCLNGEMAKLGSAADVKNVDTSRDKNILLSFESDNCLEVNCSFTNEKASALDLNNLIFNGEPVTAADLFKIHSDADVVAALANLTFISAERIGPKFCYEASNNSRKVGALGEYTACALYNHKDDIVSQERIDSLPDIFPELNVEEMDKSVAGLVQFWMSKMFGFVCVESDYAADVNAYTLKFTTDRSGKKYKPANVGYGYSYVLPILVAGLLSGRSGLLIVENPEAHLHPLAQSILGKFLAWIASNGVQVIVETHSEHILNAPRVLIVQEAFDSSDLIVFYFDDAYKDHFTPIEVEPDGRIYRWPTGFFDQMEKDNDIILGL